MRWSRLVPVVAVLAYCSRSPQEPPAVTDLVLRAWKGNPVTGCPVTLTFDEHGAFGGRAGEDGFGGEYRIDGQHVIVTSLQGPGIGGCEPLIREWMSQPLPLAVDGMRLLLGTDRLRTEDVAVSTLASSLVGLTESFARRIVETNDLAFRVVARDGDEATVTMEFKPWRVDVAIEDE